MRHLVAITVLALALLCTKAHAAPVDPPSVWTLLVYSVRLLPIEGEPGTPKYDAALAYRLELVTACTEATDSRTERYVCVKLARFESDYREDIGRCTIRGKAGDRTAWQIVPRSKEEAERLCHSLVEDARVHVERVRESRAACSKLPKSEQLALYARGNCASEEGRKLSRVRWPTDAEVRRLETERW